MKRHLIILLLCLILTGCYEKNSDDALQTYKYWAGTKPPADIELIEGKYWQSAHWTKEYKMYLKFKSTEVWWEAFLEQNFIPEDNDAWTKPSDAPSWFQPSDNSIRYGIKDDFDLGSRYFRDTLTGISYIYEIQL
ncbi:hypothetical protein [Pararhodonellum marinum]|uniref:hypothetical protein n=1 Tax=Pararhodonellum marinum TaxID=2755358 RepID=UPI001E4B521C|nr:hypothetical protein [Pararhodonellum marinum]